MDDIIPEKTHDDVKMMDFMLWCEFLVEPTLIYDGLARESN